jgi:hypothetical protein
MPARRPPLFAVALLSASALAYEVLLTRLFSITLWHHFAYMIISAALLGYGASGTFLALVQGRLGAHHARLFVAAAIACGVAMPVCFFLAQGTRFNPLELLWDPAQAAYLFNIYLLLFLPFFFAATCVCLVLSRFGAEAHRVYAFDICGAGAGSIGVVAVLFYLSPEVVLEVVGALGVGAAAVAWIELRLRPWWMAAPLAGLAACLAFMVPEALTVLRPSEYKDLSQALRVAGNRVLAESSSPLGRVTVVEGAEVPFRHAPGLSLNALTEPPAQLGVFTDGDGMSALTRFDGRLEPLAYLDQLTSALPYHLKHRPRVLVLGAGAGSDVLQAIYHGAASIDAVELNPQVVALVTGPYAAYAGQLYSRSDVKVHVKEARGFVAGSRARYDLIQLALLDSFSTASAGQYALSESTIYTVEAFEDYLAHLEAGGMLSITRWVSLPPRDTLKLFATAVAALERRGIEQPARRLVLIRGWKTATLLVKNGDFHQDEIRELREFCRARSFDLAYYPGMAAEEANRYNVLDHPYFYEGAMNLLGPQREAFIERYKFHIAPATDDRPFFFRFFKWSGAAELLSLREQGGLPLLEWGYPVLLVTLAQALAASLVLILLPVVLARRRATAANGRARTAAYFLAIGLAFMFVEIAFIHKFVLFLGHPLYAIAVVLCAFLVFAGAGSRFSARLDDVRAGTMPRALVYALAGIALFALLYVVALPSVFQGLMHLSEAARIALSAALVAPLAFCMGIPFPSGLKWVAADREQLIAWAWAVNGCASVVGAVLATLLAIHFGFSVVVVIAVALYGLALAARTP